jgi:Uma2 family endonuclease
MTPEEFLVWCQDQEGRWELVAGVPTLAMVGATRRHDTIVVRLIVALDRRLKGGRCTPQTADQAVRTGAASIRRPDVTVDCGPTADDALEASRPTAVFEVLSPSTRKTDRFRKLEEYKAIRGSMRSCPCPRSAPNFRLRKSTKASRSSRSDAERT